MLSCAADVPTDAVVDVCGILVAARIADFAAVLSPYNTVVLLMCLLMLLLFHLLLLMSTLF